MIKSIQSRRKGEASGFTLFSFMGFNNDNGVLNIVKAIRENDSFVVVSHISPDGDTLGSAAALCYVLRLLNKRCIHVCDGTASDALRQIPELNTFICQPQEIPDFDAFVAVDCADEARLGKWQDAFGSASVKMVIDHHITNKGYGDINYIKNYPACAQLIFNIIDELNMELNKEIATCLYVAFLTDTGRFSYRGVNEETMQYVARLYGYDLDFDNINRQIFSLRTFDKSKLLAKALTNLELWFDGSVSAVFIGYEDYSKLISENCDTEGIVNYAMDVKGCSIAIFAYEMEPQKVKVSLRSVSHQYNVSAIASNFGGGGHVQAAGCTVYVDIKKAQDLLYNYLQENIYK